MEVPGQLVKNVLVAADELGLPTASLLDGLNLGPADLDLPGARIPWDDAAELLDRLARVTTPEQRAELGALHGRTYPLLRVLASLVVSPRALVLLVTQALPPLLPFLAMEARDEPDGRLTIVAWLRANARPSRTLFELGGPSLAAVTELLGLPPCELETSELDEVHAVHRLRLPQARTIGERARELSSAPLTSVLVDFVPALRALEGVRAGGLELEAGSPGLESEVLGLQRELGLSRAEARVASLLSDGLSLREVAARLEVTVETVRSHVKRCYAKTGTRRQTELVARVLEWRAG